MSQCRMVTTFRPKRWYLFRVMHDVFWKQSFVPEALPHVRRQKHRNSPVRRAAQRRLWKSYSQRDRRLWYLGGKNMEIWSDLRHGKNKNGNINWIKNSQTRTLLFVSNWRTIGRLPISAIGYEQVTHSHIANWSLVRHEHQLDTAERLPQRQSSKSKAASFVCKKISFKCGRSFRSTTVTEMVGMGRHILNFRQIVGAVVSVLNVNPVTWKNWFDIHGNVHALKSFKVDNSTLLRICFIFIFRCLSTTY